MFTSIEVPSTSSGGAASASVPSSGGKGRGRGLTEKSVSPKEYKIDSKIIHRYTSALGMYELKGTAEFSTYKDINENLYTWKHYETSFKENSYGLKEIGFNLSDVNLKGTADSLTPISEVINRLHLRMNSSIITQDAY